VHWFEALGSSSQSVPAGAARVSDDWRGRGVSLQLQALQCPPFWATVEITECPAWIDATSAALQECAHAV
jgi:hypothetical protein